MTDASSARPPAHVLLNALALHEEADGARVFLENLIAGLPRAWPEARLSVLVREGTTLAAGPEVDLVALGSIRSGVARAADELVRLRRVVRRLRPDVLINPNESIPAGVRVPMVVVAQNLLFHCPDIGPLDRGPLRARVRSRLQFAYYRWRMPRAYARAAVVAPVSEHALRELARHARLDPSHAHVVPNGADRLPLVAREPRSGATRRLHVVGALAHYQRPEAAIDALAALREGGGDYELVLAGESWPGYRDVLGAHATAVGVEQRVHLAGAVGAEELARLFASAHAGLSLSACESFGIPVLEGMRAGLPHVVADEAWSADMLGEHAIRVPAGDPRAVAAGIARLEDAAEWERISASGRELAARYTWRAHAEGIARLAAGVVAPTR